MQKQVVEFTLCELENLIMMSDFCKRWFDHEYARTAVSKIREARNEIMKKYAESVPPPQQRDLAGTAGTRSRRKTAGDFNIWDRRKE